MKQRYPFKLCAAPVVTSNQYLKTHILNWSNMFKVFASAYVYSPLYLIKFVFSNFHIWYAMSTAEVMQGNVSLSKKKSYAVESRVFAQHIIKRQIANSCVGILTTTIICHKWVKNGGPCLMWKKQQQPPFLRRLWYMPWTVFLTWLSNFNDCVPTRKRIASVSAVWAVSARACKVHTQVDDWPSTWIE